jgi:hypothetical protein
MDYDIILKQAKDLLSDYKDYSNKKKFKNHTTESFEAEMNGKYAYLKNNVGTIFNSCLKGDMNLKVLIFMLNQAKELKKNNISNHDASVNVGQVLVDTFVKPNLDKEAENKNA